MKLILGHILAFLYMAVTISLAVIVGIISFIFLQLPTGVSLEDSLLALRLCFGIGSLFGIGFTLSEEGREFAKEFAEGRYK